MKYLFALILSLILSFVSTSFVQSFSIMNNESKVYIYGDNHSISTRDIGQCYGLQDRRYVKMSYTYNQIEHQEQSLSGDYLYLDEYRCDISNYQILEKGFNLVEYDIEKIDGQIISSGLVFNFDQGCLQETPGNQIKSITISYTSGEIRYDLRQGINYTHNFGTCELLSVEKYVPKQVEIIKEELTESQIKLLERFKKLFIEYINGGGDRSIIGKIVSYDGEKNILINEIIKFVLDY